MKLPIVCELLLIRTGQTTGNILAPKYYYIPCKSFNPQTPLKKKKKNHEKILSKGHPRARTMVEFKEKFPDQFFTICK